MSKKTDTIKFTIDTTSHIGVDGVFSRLLYNFLHQFGLHWEYPKDYYVDKQIKYIRENYLYLCERLQNRSVDSECIKATESEAKIFSFWDISNPPPFVESCFESQRRNAGEHEHVVLSNKTVSNYCDIPGYK